MQKTLPAFFGLALLMLFLLFACRNNTSQKAKAKSNKVIEERARLDSLAQDIEKATKSIEEQAKELEKALDTLN